MVATYTGTLGNDNVSTGYDYLYGLDGNDHLSSDRGGRDVVEGGRGSDYLFLSSSNNTTFGEVYGGDDNDTVFGATLADSLFGGDGNDVVAGGNFLFPNTPGGEILAASEPSGNDEIEGGTGTDALYGLDGNDTIYGGSGDDTGTVIAPDFNNYTNGSTFTAKAGLFGGAGDDFLDGGRGNDYLDGGADIDRVQGSGGDDSVNGGLGNDTLSGGTGTDTFVFNTALNKSTNVDNIADFVHGTDKIQLEDSIFIGLAAGTLSESVFKDTGNPGAKVDGSDRILYNHTTGYLYYDRDGDHTTYGAVKFAHVDGNLILSGSDFTVV